MEKRKPHYLRTAIQAALSDPNILNRTASAQQGAVALGMDDATVVAVIQALTLSDFDKSMTTHHDHKLWQDVYKPITGPNLLYVKFTLDAQGAFLLISFKEA